MVMIKELHPLMDYLRQHPHVGELFAFLVAFTESLPIIGTVIPGSVTMTAVGFLIGTGALPGLFTLLIAAIGALLGDAIGFGSGYWFNDGVRNIWPFRKHPKILSLGENFFRKHGGKSIFIGRFVGPARSTIPLVAGLLKLSWFRFWIAALPSAILWAIAYTVPGILLGALAKEIPKGETTRFLLYGLSFIAIVWLIFWLLQHFFIKISKGINQISQKAWLHLITHKKQHWLTRLIQNQQKPSDYHQLTLLLFAFLSSVLFLALLLNVYLKTSVTALNAPIFHLLQSFQTPVIKNIFTVISIMGSPGSMILLAIAVACGLLIKKQWRAGTHMLICMILSAGAVFVFKILSHSPRPTGFYHVASSSSFPSGHTTLSFAIMSFIAFLLSEAKPKKHRWLLCTVTTLFVTLVAFSRLYLGAHWFTDIVGSLLLGLPVFFVCIISFHRTPKTTSALKLQKPALLILLMIGFAIAWGIQIPRKFAQEQHRYVRLRPIISVKKSSWWQSPLKYTPIYRNNRFGTPFQPFNLQWLGKLSAIKRLLLKNQWALVSHHPAFESAFLRFVSYDPLDHMPLLPWLYLGKPPVLLMIKHIPNQKMIIELRLWQSNVELPDSQHPLWIGAIDLRIPPKKLMSIKGHTEVSFSQNVGLTTLFDDTKSLKRKQINIDTSSLALPWSGKILVISE